MNNREIFPATWSRRHVLLASAVTLAISSFGGSLASLSSQVMAADNPRAYQAFLRFSRFITAKQTLDNRLGQSIFVALSNEDPKFAVVLKELVMLVEKTSAKPATLQAMLDSAHPTLSPIPRLILRAWYLGFVGFGPTARAIAYESALMYPPVADVMVMPSYARGLPGYWAEPPRPSHA